jgi:hypothetical protein
MNYTLLGPFSEFKVLENDFVLWILKTNRIPPHIALSIGNQFYSISINKSELGVDLQNQIKVWKKKKLPVIGLKLKFHLKPLNLNQKLFGELIVSEKMTCLDVIVREFEQIDVRFSSEVTIHEVVRYFDSNGMITDYFQFNNQAFITDEVYKLPYYTRNDVIDYIAQLKIKSN